ncbi:TPA: hypothetical protein ACIDX2_000116 [Pseudomonas aeruginosa]
MNEFPAVKLPKLASVFLLILSLCACDPYPADSAKFKELVSSWGLRNLSVQDAGSLLAAKGFEVIRNKPGKFSDGNTIDAIQGITKDILCKIDWHIRLYLEEEKVINIDAYALYTCS